jgi:hypothetical protein
MTHVSALTRGPVSPTRVTNYVARLISFIVDSHAIEMMAVYRSTEELSWPSS